MRRVELLRYHDYITYVIDKLLDRLWNLLRRTDDELTAKAIKHIINVLEEEKRNVWFSTVCKKVFNGCKFGITDLDKIMVLNGQTKALIEYKFRREDYRKYMMFNAFQFITLKNLSIRSKIPLYYVVELGEYDERWFRVIRVDENTRYRVRTLGNGHGKDSYAVLDLNNSILMDEFEFKCWLKEVMKGVDGKC